ncbi:hypothetical protein ACVWYG_000731 [Pedobacter sp. UYEF25]
MTEVKINVERFIPGFAIVSFSYKTKSYELIAAISQLKQRDFLPKLMTEMFGFECKELKTGGGNV